MCGTVRCWWSGSFSIRASANRPPTSLFPSVCPRSACGMSPGSKLLSAVGTWTAATWGQRGGRSHQDHDLGSIDRLAARHLPKRTRLTLRPLRDTAPPNRAEPVLRRAIQTARSRGRSDLLAPAELGAVQPHAVQDRRQLARDRDDRALHPAPAGDGHAPCFQAAPLLRANKERLGALEQCGPHHRVTAFRHVSAVVSLARRISLRRQTKVRADQPRLREPGRNVHGGLERQSDHRSDTGRRHQSPA